MKLRSMFATTTAVLSMCAMLTVGLAPAANAATKLTTPAPVVLQDAATKIMQVSTAARPKGTVGYRLQQIQANKSWKTLVTCSRTCSYPLSKTAAHVWRLVAYGTNGATSAPSDVFASLPLSAYSNGGGDRITLFLNKYNLYALSVGALKYDASLAAACGIDKGVQSGLKALEKRSLQAAAAQGFADPFSDVGAAALQFEKLIRSTFGSNCDNIKAYDKLLIAQGAAVFSKGSPQQIVVSSQVLASVIPTCSMFFGDGAKKSVQNTVVYGRQACVEFARKLWISA